VDESTAFKNWTGSKGKRKKNPQRKVNRRGSRMPNLRKLLPTMKKRIILTGTPAANSLSDIFAQIYILDDGLTLGKNLTVFRSRFCTKGGWMGRQWMFRPEMEEELYRAVSPLVIRAGAEDYLDMPELVTHNMYCRMPEDAKREYARLKRDLLAQLESGDILAMNAASAYMKMKQAANGAVYDEQRNVHEWHTAKLDMHDELIEELAGKPLLTFFQFKHDAVRIKKRHPKAEILSGKTKPSEVEGLLRRWNAGDIRLFLVQPQAASHGLNLQSGPCADIAWFGIGDSPEVYDQAVRRIYRQGQKNRQVRVHRLLCEGTVDGIIKERLEGKFRIQNEFFKALIAHAKS